MNMHISLLQFTTVISKHMFRTRCLYSFRSGVYNLDNNWIPVKKAITSLATYSLQAGYGVGRGEAFSYIYSKD